MVRGMGLFFDLEDGDACRSEGLDKVWFGGDGGGSDESEGGMAQRWPCKSYELPDVACSTQYQDSFALPFSSSCHTSLSVCFSLSEKSKLTLRIRDYTNGRMKALVLLRVRCKGMYLYLLSHVLSGESFVEEDCVCCDCGTCREGINQPIHPSIGNGSMNE